MADLSHVLNRLLTGLADDLNYDITPDETSLYIKELLPMGLRPLIEALLVLREEDRPSGTFPPISEIKRLIDKMRDPEGVFQDAY